MSTTNPTSTLEGGSEVYSSDSTISSNSSDTITQFTTDSFTGFSNTTSDSTIASTSFTTDKTTPSPGLEGGAIAGIVIGSLVGVALILALAYFIYKRYRPQATPKQPNYVGEDLTSGNKNAHFYVNLSDDQIRQDFRELNRYNPSHPSTVGLSASNTDSNRFANIVPYDFNRVQLRDNSYINASHIKLGKCPTHFIASQDPKPTEEDNFWRMISEHNVRVIVRLSADNENSDNTEIGVYLPEDEGGTWVPWIGFEILYKEHIFEETYIKKTLKVNEKDLYHYHMKGWGRDKVEISARKTVMAIRKIREDFSYLANPATSRVLVHSGAGAGRIGAFIAIWSLMDDKEASVLETCKSLRDQRKMMVTNESHYTYIHECFKIIRQG